MQSRFFEGLERRTLLSTSVTGTVFDDLNGNGRRDSGEPGLAGQIVYMDLNLNGKVDLGEPQAQSLADGRYTISPSIDISTRMVRIRMDVPEGRRLSFPESIFYEVTVGALPVFHELNFGSTTTGVIRGTVFNDVNGNGLKDSGEAGLAGWTVFLDKNDDGIYQPGIEKVRVTNSRGEYRFAGLTQGTYRVKVVGQTGFVQTNPPGGGGFTVRLLNPAQSFSNRNFGQQESSGAAP